MSELASAKAVRKNISSVVIRVEDCMVVSESAIRAVCLLQCQNTITAAARAPLSFRTNIEYVPLIQALTINRESGPYVELWWYCLDS